MPSTNRIWLPFGGIAISGRSGSGKSTILQGSKHVHHLLLADTGSIAAHKAFYRGSNPKDDIVCIDANLDPSPIEVIRNKVRAWSEAGHIWALDSWTTLQEQQCSYVKRKANKNLSLPMMQNIIGDLRDLALILAQSGGITICNTSPGGLVKQPDGNVKEYPKGCLVGFPSLVGLGAASETLLARWSTSWVAFPGHKETPRGLLLPHKDLRPAETANYVPIKDPCRVLQETEECGVDRLAPLGECTIDLILERIAAKFPNPDYVPPPEPVANGQPTKSTTDRIIGLMRAIGEKTNFPLASQTAEILAEHKVQCLEALTPEQSAAVLKKLGSRVADVAKAR